MANNFELHQEFSANQYDMISKYNLLNTSLNNGGYENHIINPTFKQTFLNDKTYSVPASNPNLSKFGLSGWIHSTSGNNARTCVKLNTIVTDSFVTYTAFKNCNIFNLNLKSSMNLYTDSTFRFDKDATYIFSVEYDVILGTTSDKDLDLVAPQHWNGSSFDTIAFGSTGGDIEVSTMQTVLNNTGKYIKYYYIKSNNYEESSATFRFAINATTANDTARIRIFNCLCYKGDILFNGLSSKNDNLIKKTDLLAISDNGYDFETISQVNRVTVGGYGAKYSDLGVAIGSEISNTVFDLIGPCTILSPVVFKEGCLVNGNNNTITVSSTINITSSSNVFTNCRFNLNNLNDGMIITSGYNTFNNCQFYNSENNGIQINNTSYNTFNDCNINECLGLALHLTNSTDCIIRVKNITNFFKTATIDSKAISLTNSSRNIIEVAKFENLAYDEILEVNYVPGPIDSIVESYNSYDNILRIGKTNVFQDGESPYQIIKFYSSNNNRVNFYDNMSADTATQNIYDLVYSDGNFKNYIENPNVIDNTTLRFGVTTNKMLPAVIYSDSINDSSISKNDVWSAYKCDQLQNLVTTTSYFKSDDSASPKRGIGQDETGLTDINFCVGGTYTDSKKQRVFIKNDGNNSYIQVFGNSGVDNTSTLANENVIFSKWNTSTTKMNSFNVYAETTTIGSTTVGITGNTTITGTLNVTGVTTVADSINFTTASGGTSKLISAGNFQLQLASGKNIILGNNGGHVGFVYNGGYTYLGENSPKFKKHVISVTGITVASSANYNGNVVLVPGVVADYGEVLDFDILARIQHGSGDYRVMKFYTIYVENTTLYYVFTNPFAEEVYVDFFITITKGSW
jgi:hypothetical protein